jgi:hypothetical protein
VNNERGEKAPVVKPNQSQIMNNIPEIQEIRARLAHLNSDLRLSYSAAQRHQNDQSSRDRCVMEVVRLHRQIRLSERRLNLLLAEDRSRKVDRTAAVTTPAT